MLSGKHGKSGMEQDLHQSPVQRLCRIFKWAVEQEMVTAGVWNALKAVSGLRAGKTAAGETEPVKPVAIAEVGAILPHLPP